MNRTGLPVAITDYINEFQYSDGVLKFFSTSEGYVEHNGGIYKYIYQYKDHLGNIRLSYDRNLVIQEENNYYPFGLKHFGYNNNSISTNDALKYKYNKKEFQDEIGLNMYDFGARNYEPALGRWMNIDPLAETSRRFSPYVYTLNNPIYFIDPDGMQADDWKTNVDGVLVFDKNLTKENASSQLKEGESYVGSSFIAKDQNGNIYSFNNDGSINASQATESIFKASGIDTSSMMQVESSVSVGQGIDVVQPQKGNILLSITVATATADALAPDPSDAVAIPKTIGYGIAASAALITDAILRESDVVMQFAKTKPGKSGEVSGEEHTSGARKSIRNDHEAGQARKQQVNTDKKRQGSTWTQNPNKKK